MSRLGFGYTCNEVCWVDGGRSGGGSEDGYRVSERLEVQFESGTMRGRVACGGATGGGTELEVRDSEQACSVVRRSCHYMSRLGFGYTVQRGASQRVDSGDGGGDVIMRWGLPSNASRAQDRQDDSTPVELEIRFHSVTVAVDMELEVRDSEQACSVVRRSCHYMSRLGFGYTVQRGASQRVDSGDGGGDVIMRWGLPSNASRAQDRQDDSTPVELEIRFHSVTVAVDMGSGRYDSLGYLGERVNPGSSHVHGASQRVDSGDGGGDVIMRWGLPSNASRAQDRQDDSTPVELEIRFHSVTVAVDMELEALKAPEVRCKSGTGVDVLGVAAPHGPAVVWYAIRRVHARMGVGGVGGSAPGDSQRRYVALARIVDVLGVAAPHESECPARDAWANPVAEANDPSSFVLEYAACGVWRPHTFLPFSRMSLVAYLRGWNLEVPPQVTPGGPTSLWHELSTCWVWRRHMVRPVYDMRFVECMRGWSVCDIVGRFVQASESVWEMVGRIAQAREEADVAGWDEVVGGGGWRAGCGSERSEFTRFGIRRLWRDAAPHGPGFFPYESRRVPARMGVGGSAAGDTRRSDVALARIVDVLGVAAPLLAGGCNSLGYVEADSVWEMVGRIAQAREIREQKDAGACESECPAWDAWANPVAEANDPSSLVSEYAACGVWRPHTVLPFSRMSLVAYLRGWAWEVPPQVTARGPTSLWHELSACWVWRRHMVRPVYDMRFVECMRGWVRGYWLCVVMQSVWEMVGRIAQARESVCDIVGRILQAWESVWEIVGRIAQAREMREQKDAGACGVGGDSQRSDVALARIVDVLGVAAPLLAGGCNSLAYVSVCDIVGCILQAAEVAGWDEGVVGGGWRAGWEGKTSVWEMVGRIAQAREVLGEKIAEACGDRQRSDITRARSVDVLGVAAPHGPAVVWYAIRRVHARMDERLPVVSRYAVCLGDARAFCSGHESAGRVGGAAGGGFRLGDARAFCSDAGGGFYSVGYVVEEAYNASKARDAAQSVCDIVGCILQASESVCDIVGRFVQASESGWEMVERFVQVRLSVCEIVGRILQEVESVCDIVGCILQTAEVLSVREEDFPGACSVPWCNCRTT
ncbi:hypothetical protein TGRH88_084290 [Toxoplasma gondii]|uniref:Uncharacterized protein n=1 Tax=Toxoplasma gondii TaxID=5811 RepID=A0A7J6KGT3_TOXGO|nr:hypothetical protein TGRH88_084290 [Toxoplasma gondii]